MRTYIKVLSAVSEVTEAPDMIKVLPYGYVSSEKGDFIVDSENYRLIKEHMQHRNIDIVIDYEHQTLENVQAPAGGWIKELLLEKDGIYAKVEWTQRAKTYLSNKEYRYLSPVVAVNSDDRRVAWLHSAALTNTPAINGMAPIVNSFKLEETDSSSVILNHILKMLNLSKEDLKKYGTGKE